MIVKYGRGFVPSLRQKIDRLHDFMERVPQVDCPVRHYFAPGLFAREMTIPAGVTVNGAVHKTKNLAVLSKGRLVMGTEDGPVEVCAPFTRVVEPGEKNSVTALEECVWTNFLANPTDETDIAKLVEIFTESKACELLGGSQNKQLARAAERLE